MMMNQTKKDYTFSQNDSGTSKKLPKEGDSPKLKNPECDLWRRRVADHKVVWPPLDNHVTFYSGNKTHFSLLGSHTVRSGLQPIRELEIDELEIDEKLQEDDLLKRNELEKVGKNKE